MADERVFIVGGLLHDDGRFAPKQEIYLRSGTIEHILSGDDTSEHCNGVRRAYNNADIVNMPSAIMVPGLINFHHHAYSALARGIPIKGELRPFRKTLENLWWRLDRSLDEEAVHISGLVTGMDCLRHGCTTIVDHHSSPNSVENCLDTLADAFSNLSMTSVLCSEISDRNGPQIFKQTLDENLSFEKTHRATPHTRGLIGLHASFTLSSRSLQQIARVLPPDAPVHVHVAEDVTDVDHAQKEGFLGPLHRLKEHGLLNRKSLIVHGIHLCEDELALLDSLKLYVVHNAQSNFNNSVGYPKLDSIPKSRLLLGTDGMNSNMIGATLFSYLAYLGSDQTKQDPASFLQRALFENPSSYLSDFFGRPVGRIREGIPADFAIFDYDNPTPITPENIMMHILFGLSDAPLASWVYSRGTPVVMDSKLYIENETLITDAARKKASDLWQHY